jgi:phage shock protein A
MTLITRIARLFRADLHAVLDRVEEPDVLLRQAIREMEEDLDGDERRRRTMQRETGRLAAREDELHRSLAELEDELNLCFAAGKTDLARALVRRKLEITRNAAALARKRETLEAGRADLETRIRENRARLEHVRQRAGVLAAGIQDTPDGTRHACPGFAIGDEDVEVAFLREQQKRSQP